MIKDIQKMRNERGFTLIELLVVIVILGILAAVVVFAVGGLSDKGEQSSCKIDTRTLRTAEEAFFAKYNQYAVKLTAGDVGTTTPDESKSGEQQLIDAKLLSDLSSYHDITGNGTDTKSFTIRVQDSKCGTPTNDVDASPTDTDI